MDHWLNGSLVDYLLPEGVVDGSVAIEICHNQDEIPLHNAVEQDRSVEGTRRMHRPESSMESFAVL